MKLHRMRLTNYRGIANVEHRFNASGITVLEGPNESGKSCIVEALDNLIDEYDSAKSRAIKDLMPAGKDVGSEAEAEIETGAYQFTYRKRWNKAPDTELRITQPRLEVLSGRPAHERVQEILRETLDVPLYKALRITQGTGFDLPELPTDSTLTRALDAAAGGTPITAREADLIAFAEAEYKQYWTEGGRLKDLVRDADAKVDAAQTAEAEVTAKLRDADQDAERHEDASRRIAEFQRRRGPLETVAQEWEAKRIDAEVRQEALRTLNALNEAAKNAHGTATAQLTARTELIAELDRLDKGHKTAKKQFDDAAGTVEATRAAAASARAASDDAAKHADKARDLARIRKNDSDAIHLAFDLTLLEERREKITKAQNRQNDTEKLLAANKVTDTVLEKARKLEQEVAVAEAALGVASPILRIHAKRAFEGKLDGKKISLAAGKTHETPVPSAAKLDLGDVHVEIRAGTSLDELQDGDRRARADVKKLLDEHGLASVAEALAANKARHDAEASKKQAEADVRDSLRSDKILAFKTVEEMDAKILDVRGRVTNLRAGRLPTPAVAKNKEEAVRLSTEAQAAGDTAGASEKTARATSEAAAAEYAKLAEQHAGRKARIEQAAESLRLAAQRLEDARRGKADEALQVSVETKAKEARDAHDAWSAAKTQTDKADPEAIIDRAKTARAAVQRVDVEIRELEDLRSSVGGRLQVYAEQGLHETQQRLEAELDAARAAATSLHRRAETAKTLYQVLMKHRAAAQKRYVAPLRERIVKLGRYVYGDSFDVELDETLAITNRTLGGTPLPYRTLSQGAKEQLSLLLRLACALTVPKDGTSVPLILDDALGYTDPKRLEAMGAVLDRAGRDCQVVLLTCTPDRYQAVSSAVVRRTTA